MSDELPVTLLVKHCETNGRAHVCAYRHGTADEQVLAQIWQHMGYDLTALPPDARAAIERRYKAIEQPTIVDGGAHIGLAAVWFALTYPEAHVIAIEPHPGNFALLQRNTKRLNVQAIRGALGAAWAQVVVTDPGEGNWGYQTERAPALTDDAVIACPVTEFIDPDRIFIVKLDIEGAEEGVLRNPAWVAGVPVVIMEVHAWVDRHCINPLYAEGRQVHQVGENIVSVLL